MYRKYFRVAFVCAAVVFTSQVSQAFPFGRYCCCLMCSLTMCSRGVFGSSSDSCVNLYSVAQAGNITNLQNLKNIGCDFTKKSLTRLTPLDYAASSGKLEAVLYVVETVLSQKIKALSSDPKKEYLNRGFFERISLEKNVQLFVKEMSTLST